VSRRCELSGFGADANGYLPRIAKRHHEAERRALLPRAEVRPAALGTKIAEQIESTVRARHRRRLRNVGWEHALDANGHGYSAAGIPPRRGNDLEVLIDGAAVLPAMAEELAKAESHVHLMGWYLSPHLQLTRGDHPAVVRNLLAELAERIDVRVLLWGGAPIRLFRPSRTDVRLVRDELCEKTKVDCEIDSCVGPLHCHHEKTILIDDRVAFVGGIDLTLDAGDPYDTPQHEARGRIGWHDATVRLRGPAVADVAEHFRLRWEAAKKEPLPPPAAQPEAGDIEVQVVRTVRDGIFRKLPRGDYSLLEAYIAALRSARKLVYLENQFLWSPEIVGILADKLRNPPADDFRIVLLLPAQARDGTDVSCGQVAALIDADDDNARFLACTLFARTETLSDLVYVHSKIGIVDDRWLTVGSANLNSHSLFNDTELNVVTLDPRLARDTRLRLWSEHLERPVAEIDGDPTDVFESLWEPIAEEQLERLDKGAPLTHRLVMLPGVSRGHRRVLGPILGHIYDP
jgi:phosphatidylserine/phosphatidylglycerophosphate/cardiolipin synthase-like enzyme